MLITLTTDFGEGSPYVAQMKAAVLSVNPQATLIDITHSIEPQNVQRGALVLADVAGQFPPGSIHVGVVDPGVGTQRKIVYAELGDQRFVAPDNGLLSLVARQQPVTQVFAVEAPQYWRHPVSATFHGRDIMAPVAAHLTLGVQPQQLGTQQSGLMQLPWPEVECGARELVGSVVMVDHFGNLITNITRALVPSHLAPGELKVACGSRSNCTVVETYGQAASGSVVALLGSSDRLEIAVTNGNAARTIGCGVGERVHVTWSPEV